MFFFFFVWLNNNCIIFYIIFFFFYFILTLPIDSESIGSETDARSDDIGGKSLEVEYLIDDLEDPLYDNRNVVAVLQKKKHKSVKPKVTEDIIRFVCDCSRVYSTLASYRYHKYECGTQRHFECPHCPYKGKRNTTLVKHINAKHRDIVPPIKEESINIKKEK